MNISQLPPEVDPQLFNLTLAWMEYLNRLLGATVGVLIAIVGILALLRFRSHFKIVVPAVFAALLTAFQGWQGSRVVASGLEPMIVSAHLMIALVIAGLLVYVWLQAFYLVKATVQVPTSRRVGMRRWVGVLWLLTLVQVILGTQVREAIEIVSARFPLAFGAELFNRVGSVKYVHPALGVVTAILCLIVVVRIVRTDDVIPSLLWQSAWTMGGLMLLQLVIGAVLVAFGDPAVGQVLHLWVASLLTGVILISYASLGLTGGKR